MFIYINGNLPICQHICHPEYTYRAYHIYRRVSALICMDIQIGRYIGRLVDMYIHWPVYGVYEDLSTSSLPPLYTQAYLLYKDAIGDAGLLSSSASVKAIYGVCFLLWGYGWLVPSDIEL